FFFQAEDGIRDRNVTGVQTCALPIYSKWYLVGLLGMITCFILLSFYSVVGGWILLYMVEALLGNVSGISSDSYGELFNTLISNPTYAILSQFIFMIITIWVVARGIQKGIEKASKIMM